MYFIQELQCILVCFTSQKAGKKSGKRRKRKRNRSVSSVTTIQPTTLGELLLEPIATSASLNEELNRIQTGVS